MEEIKPIQLRLIEMPTFTSVGKIQMYCEDKETFNKARNLFDYEIDRRGLKNSRTQTSLELHASDGTIEELRKLSHKLGSTSFTRALEELICQIREQKKSIPLIWQSPNIPYTFDLALQQAQCSLQMHRMPDPQGSSQRKHTHPVCIQHPEQYHQYNMMLKSPQPQGLSKQGWPQFREQKNFVHLAELAESRQNSFSMTPPQLPCSSRVFPYQQPLQKLHAYYEHNTTTRNQESYHQRNRLSERTQSRASKPSCPIEFWQQKHVRPEGSAPQNQSNHCNPSNRSS